MTGLMAVLLVFLMILMTRIMNVYTPWKVSGGISAEKQFLIDIEYDGRPAVNKDKNGIKYTNEERS